MVIGHEATSIRVPWPRSQCCFMKRHTPLEDTLCPGDRGWLRGSVEPSRGKPLWLELGAGQVSARL